MRTITLNTDAFLKAYNELNSKIDFETDLVIEILDAGGYIGKVMRKDLRYENSDFAGVKIQRANKRLKQNIFIKFLLKLMPYVVLDKLRNYESQKARKSISEMELNRLCEEKVKISLGNISNNKTIDNILIVDDAVDTGKTALIVKRNLKRLFPQAQIKVAVISWTLENSLIQPDFYIFKDHLVRFPWSEDYKGNDFET